MHIDGVGTFNKDRSGGYISKQIPIKVLGGHAARFMLEETLDNDDDLEKVRRAITSFLALEPTALTDVEEHVFRYYLDCKDYFEPGDAQRVEIAAARDVWKHVQFGPELNVRRRTKDGVVYMSLGCSCDWEPEHGLQIVFKDGQRVNKVGSFNGHLTHSDAYADASLEDVIYRPRQRVAVVPQAPRPEGPKKTPQKKKAESYKKDRRNVYGENNKSSRKNIPRAKARDRREARRVVRQGLARAKGAVDEATVDKAHTKATTKRHPSFKKQPDKPLGQVLKAKKKRKPKR